MGVFVYGCTGGDLGVAVGEDAMGEEINNFAGIGGTLGFNPGSCTFLYK